MLVVSVQEAVSYLQEGKIIVYPTEAVYGLGCDPDHAQACLKLHHFKQRSNKGFILVASSFAQVVPWVNWSQLTQGQVARIKHSWPGHTTWILPAAKQASSLVLGPKHTIAVRVSPHPVVQALCHEFKGPIVSTSANLPGEPPAKSIEALAPLEAAGVANYVVSGDLGNSRKPSQIIDAIKNVVVRG